ncbi:MAG TPA: hypothetical protein ENI97_09695 [Gammaproteobacteria bacterium]|nr:hypothetical protein [Gammaproteobacteria bacterium]
MRRWIVFFAWLGLAGQAWPASNLLLESIEYINVAGVEAIEIGFSDPVQYLSHMPPERGLELRVSIASPSFPPRKDVGPFTQEMNAPKDSLIPLKRVSLSGDDAGDLTVHLQFERVVHFKVGAGSRRNTLRVLLPEVGVQPTVAVAPELAAVSSALAAEDEALARILQEGRKALQRRQLQRAINIFTKLLSMPPHRYLRDALELLGVARERNGQKAHAKAIYQKYLQRYPKGEGAARVKQRLADLISGQMKPRPRLKAKKTMPEKGFRSDIYGSLAQFYYFGQNSIDGEASTLDESLLLNQLSLTWRLRGDDVEIRNFFYANQHYDFVSEVERPLTIESAYSKYTNDRLQLSGQFGRQTGSSGGVLGKFDGLKLGYDLSRRFRLMAQTGFPVDVGDKRRIQTNKPFIGLSAELSGGDQGVDILPYCLHQKVDGIVDRFAVGSEFRFFHPLGNFYSMLDYDVSYRALNIYLFRGQYNWRKATSFNFNFDYRKNPLLFTSNALINQLQADSIADLLDLYSEDEVRAMAEERVGSAVTLSGGVSHSFSDRYQLRGEITRAQQIYKVDDINAGVLASENDSQTYLFLQFIANQWINSRDTTVLGVRLSDTRTYNELSFIASNRLPLGDFWRFDLRARADLRSNEGGEELIKLRPSMKVDYLSDATLHFIAELGYEWWRYSGNSVNPDYSRLFAHMGYRWNF